MNPLKAAAFTIITIVVIVLIVMIPSEINKTKFCEEKGMEKIYENEDYYCFDKNEMKMYRIRVMGHNFIFQSEFALIKEVVALE